MAIVQSTKTGASITVEATSPGLAPASVTIAAGAATLRPQVAVWEREAPVGAGITGLWRPIPRSGDSSGLLALLLGGGDTVFSLRQDGNSLTGSMEGAGGGFFGGNDAPLPIEEGKVDGDTVSFKAGNSTYAGTLKGDQIELQRTADFGSGMPRAPEAPAGPHPAIGPPPDGSDPSMGTGRGRPPVIAIVLHRVQR